MDSEQIATIGKGAGLSAARDVLDALAQIRKAVDEQDAQIRVKLVGLSAQIDQLEAAKRDQGDAQLIDALGGGTRG